MIKKQKKLSVQQTLGEKVNIFVLSMNNQSKKPIKRLWISSQTDKAIKEGFDAKRRY